MVNKTEKLVNQINEALIKIYNANPNLRPAMEERGIRKIIERQKQRKQIRSNA